MRRLVTAAALLTFFVSVEFRAGWQEAHAAQAGKKPAGKTADPVAKLSDKELLKQWDDLTARREKLQKSIEQLRTDFQSAKTAEAQQKVQATAEKLRAEYEEEIQPGLLKLGPAVFERRPNDPVAAQIAIGGLVEDGKYAEVVAILQNMMKGDGDNRGLIENAIGMLFGENRFKDVTAVADKLAENKDASGRLLVLDSTAHFAYQDFDKARELAMRALKADPGVRQQAQRIIQDCEEQPELWKKELAIRNKEAKADDLPRVLFKTTKGDIVLELFENEAPNTVANFITLVEAKKYDKIKFHRVIPGFMAQGGDPNTLDNDPRNDGQGGPGYTIPCECYTPKARMHFQGSLSMAHAGKDTGGSQFFLTFVPTTHLNWSEGKTGSSHTVFGRVIEGMDVMLSLKGPDERTGEGADQIISAKVIRKRDHPYVVKKGKGRE
jgi:cyclophilin family peptidyl-prolyl cis-trans isomerase